MEKVSKACRDSLNLAKNKFEVVLGKYKPDEKKKFRKSHFFGMTYFLGRPIAQKMKNDT